MAEQGASGKIPLTIQLSAELAARLKAAAETQKRAPADLAAELLDRYLPRSAAAKAKPGNIPYT
jgi:hypothetical protein